MTFCFNLFDGNKFEIFSFFFILKNSKVINKTKNFDIWAIVQTATFDNIEQFPQRNAFIEQVTTNRRQLKDIFK